jgi:hypothetical protein
VASKETYSSFAAMRAGLVERGFIDESGATTDAGNAFIDDLLKDAPSCALSGTPTTEKPVGPTNEERVSAPSIAPDGERRTDTAQSEASTSHSNIERPSDIGQTMSPATKAETLPESGSNGSKPTTGETSRSSGTHTKSEKRSQRQRKSSANSDGNSSMEIRTTRDLRAFLAETMVLVRSGKCTANDANAIAKLSSQINQSLAIEVNAALRQGLDKGAFIDGNPLRLADDRAADMTQEAWCDQCDGRVTLEDAASCRSRVCSLRARDSDASLAENSRSEVEPRSGGSAGLQGIAQKDQSHAQ